MGFNLSVHVVRLQQQNQQQLAQHIRILVAFQSSFRTETKI